MIEKIEALCKMITEQQHSELHRNKLDCEVNMQNHIAHYKDGLKYIKVDVGGSGRLMIEKSTGYIFGIKAYGQIHRGHYYGTLDSVNQYYWGHYYPQKIA